MLVAVVYLLMEETLSVYSVNILVFLISPSLARSLLNAYNCIALYIQSPPIYNHVNDRYKKNNVFLSSATS